MADRRVVGASKVEEELEQLEMQSWRVFEIGWGQEKAEWDWATVADGAWAASLGLTTVSRGRAQISVALGCEGANWSIITVKLLSGPRREIITPPNRRRAGVHRV